MLLRLHRSGLIWADLLVIFQMYLFYTKIYSPLPKFIFLLHIEEMLDIKIKNTIPHYE